ncbi:MAG: hypothetical protein ACLRTQ_04335 [Candidatus Borkfalkia sp.]
MTRALDFITKSTISRGRCFRARKVPALCENVRDGLVCYGLGGWNYPKNVSFAVCPTELTDSCYYLRNAANRRRTCAENAETYAAQAEKTARAIAEKIRA